MGPLDRDGDVILLNDVILLADVNIFLVAGGGTRRGAARGRRPPERKPRVGGGEARAAAVAYGTARQGGGPGTGTGANKGDRAVSGKPRGALCDVLRLCCVERRIALSKNVGGVIVSGMLRWCPCNVHVLKEGETVVPTPVVLVLWDSF